MFMTKVSRLQRLIDDGHSRVYMLGNSMYLLNSKIPIHVDFLSRIEEYTSPCIVQDFVSILAFSNCSILFLTFPCCFSCADKFVSCQTNIHQPQNTKMRLNYPQNQWNINLKTLCWVYYESPEGSQSRWAINKILQPSKMSKICWAVWKSMGKLWDCKYLHNFKL